MVLIRRLVFAVSMAAAVLGTSSHTAAGESPYRVFESPQSRPLAISPDGNRLYALNSPAGRLEVFNLGEGPPVARSSVSVGIDPVAVALHGSGEAWVVNQVSDNVSIVDLTVDPPAVKQTIALCDEPSDIVFAGPDRSRAFISMARRGQNCPVPQKPDTPSTPRALVMVFDAANPGSGLGGNPLTTLELFGDAPRALTVSGDGSTVYAAVFRSGNQTTSVHELTVCDGGAEAAPCEVDGRMLPGGLPAPNANHAGVAAPEVGLIVKYDPQDQAWEDELGRNWNAAVRFNLPDLDVFRIDANATVPAETGAYAGVGTVLFNMAVNPVSGDVYVSNTEANNHVRFEGPGTHSSTVRGNLHRSRISVLRDGEVLPRHLNKHIDYAASSVPPAIKDKSLAIPMGMVVSPDGQTLYLAAFGSSRIAALDTAALAADTFVPDAGTHIEVGGGPTGMVLDAARNRMYVLTRFDNSLVTVDLASGQVLSRLPMWNPEPASVVRGRPVLYDARLTTSNGESPCASCHVSGNFDGLAWDLGNPDGNVIANPNPLRSLPGAEAPDFHPMKGPMLTQSLRGMAHAGPMHFRGDRSGAMLANPTGPLDERGAFLTFQPAFGGLLGRQEGALTDDQINAFADFVLQVTYPPNPNRPLDNQLVGEAAAGSELFRSLVQFGEIAEHASCVGCHVVDPGRGFFGQDKITTQGVLEPFKTPHMRNLYERIGMFGMTEAPLNGETLLFVEGDTSHQGDQIRGFGYDHAGAVDSLWRFTHYILFTYPQAKTDSQRFTSRKNLAAYMLAFETNMAPIVGQQVTIDAGAHADQLARIDLMIERSRAPYPNPENAAAKECDLVATARVGVDSRAWVFSAGGKFAPVDDAAGVPLTRGEILELAKGSGQAVTFTCLPSGMASSYLGGPNRKVSPLLAPAMPVVEKASTDRAPANERQACGAPGSGSFC
jgi:DNA-binding beta-propeller fold protein YncE